MLTTPELNALISLLDDDDAEVSFLVEKEIRQAGDGIIPLLENRWESEATNSIIQRRIEQLIHAMQYEQVLERLKKWRNGGSKNLMEGLWAVATYQYPDLSLEKLAAEIEQMYIEAWLEFRPEMNPIDQIRTLNYVFHEKLKFVANTKAFHSPNNSMINVVLDNKRGNPIALCSLYLMVAQRLDMPVYGVNLPNLFVLTYKTDNVQFYINVFNKGLVFMKSDIDHYVKQLGLPHHDSFYNPCNNTDIVKRFLRNLAVAFEKLNEHEKAKEIERMSLIISE